MNVSKATDSNQNSPLIEMISHLGRPCTVPLILALGDRSYNADIHELRNSIDVSEGKKLSTATISKCLLNLEQIGVVEGTVHAQSPPRAEYCLTMTGQQLYRHLLQIRHLAENAASDRNLVDSMSAC